MDDLLRDRFATEGWLRLDGLLGPDEVAALREDATRLCSGGYGPFAGWRGPHDDQEEDEVLSQYLCVHFPHKLSPVMRRAMADPRLVQAMTALVGPNVKCAQSMLFVRPAGKPGQAWHQDEAYVPTRDRSLVAAWIALDDARVENGCLWVIPGSHRQGVLWPHLPHGDPDFDPVGEARHHPYREADAVPLEIDAGGVLLFSGHLLHRSLPNRATSGFRRALSFHYMRAESLLPWMGAERREHVGAADCRDVVMVAGEDPYAFKGTEELCFPWARPPA